MTSTARGPSVPTSFNTPFPSAVGPVRIGAEFAITFEQSLNSASVDITTAALQT